MEYDKWSDNQQTAEAVLAVVQLMRLRPTDLLKLRGPSYEEIQDVLSRMLEKGEVILSSDRYLEVPCKDPKCWDCKN